MENARKYVGALIYQKEVLDLMENFINLFNKEDTPGYLFLENKTSNSVDVRMGSEKFTILSKIGSNGKIIFNVFKWEFDLSSLTRYTSKRIEELTLIKDGASLEFKNIQFKQDKGRDFKHLLVFDQPYKIDIIEPFFNQMESYIDNKNTEKNS